VKRRWWFIGLGLELGGHLAPSLARAQAGYHVTTVSRSYVRLGAEATPLTPGLGDGDTAHVVLPFDFSLFGQPMRDLYINANGLISFEPIMSGFDFPNAMDPDPTVSAIPHGYIAPLWGDFCSSSDLVCSVPMPLPDIGILTAIDATPGEGSIAIEWRSIRVFSDQLTASALNFQAVLHEGPAGAIDVAYGPMLFGEDSNHQPPIVDIRIGIESRDGTLGFWIPPCAGSAPCVARDIAGLGGQLLRITQDAGPDVVLDRVVVPNVAYPGLSLPIQAELVSRHGAAIGPFSISVAVLPPDDTSTAAATPILSSPPIVLQPFEDRWIDLSTVVPLGQALGRSLLLISVDPEHAIADIDRRNNTRIAGPLRFAAPAADFKVDSVRPLATAVRPGDSLRVRVGFENAGNAPGAPAAELVISGSGVISPDHPVIAALAPTPLGPGAAVSATVTATIPAGLPTGAYFVGLIVNPTLSIPELDASNDTGSSTASIAVWSDQLAIVTAAFPPALRTVFYSAPIDAIGGQGPIALRWVDGQLPRGVIFDEPNRQIFGIPLELGSFSPVFEARSGSLAARKTIPLSVTDPDAPLTIASNALPRAIVGSAYGAPILVAGGERPYQLGIGGALPEGLVLGSDGWIFGVPVRTGTSTFVARVSDALGRSATSTLTLVVEAPGGLSIVPSRLPDATLGQAYRTALEAVGGLPPLVWSPSGPLPPGLQLNAQGILLGIPTELGTTRFRVAVKDSSAAADRATFWLTVSSTASDLSIVTAALPPAFVGTRYRAVVSAHGGRTPYAWSVLEDEGALPAGFQLVPGDGSDASPDDRVLIGTPDHQGIWPFTLRVRDGSGAAVERPFALVAGAAPPSKGCGCRNVDEPASGLLGLALLLGARRLVQQRRRDHE
jgi:hypothetical protein